MAENPYEASDVATSERRPVTPFAFTWLRVGAAGLTTIVIISATLLLLFEFANGEELHDAFMNAIIRFFGSDPTNRDTFIFTIAVIVSFYLPYVLLTLIVFVLLLRWLTRCHRPSHCRRWYRRGYNF